MGFCASTVPVLRDGGWCLLPSFGISNRGKHSQRFKRLSESYDAWGSCAGTCTLPSLRSSGDYTTFCIDLSLLARREGRMARRLDWRDVDGSSFRFGQIRSRPLLRKRCCRFSVRGG